MSYGTLSQGSVAAPALSVPSPNTANLNQWIHDVWSYFTGDLFSYTLGLEHEAAAIVYQTKGDPAGVTYQTAKAVLGGCAQLIKIQAATAKYVETYAADLGLGQIAVPVIAGFAATAVAAVIVWSFERYMALRAALSAVSAGQVTASQASNLLSAAGPIPGASFLGSLGSSVGKVVGLVAVAGLAWWIYTHHVPTRRRQNPDLILLGANPQPDDVWSMRVLDLDYIHADDGQAYTHHFRPGVRMQALEDGSVRLFNPHRRIWKEF